MKKHYGAMILAALSIVPLILWLNFVGLGSVTGSFGGFIASLGKAAALSGIVLYSLMPILSMRHSAIEKTFGGLDKVYSLHKSSGKVSFYLILLHPILLGSGLFITGRKLAVVWDWSSILIITGLIALGILVFVTGVTIYAHIKHQKWIWIHRLFGWLVPVFFLHALLARGQIVNNKLLLSYMLLVGAAGFSAFLYRSVFSRFLIKRYQYIVSEVNHMGDKIAEIVLKPTGVPISFHSGQFAYLAFDAAGIDPEAHPYSFSSANDGPYVKFTVKALGDDTTTLQSSLQPGTKATIEGPYGNFSYINVKNRKQVWIAGGIGITPFLSMARDYSGKKDYDIRFFYATESLEDAVFLQDFIDLTRDKPDNFDTNVVSKDMSGFVSVELLKESLDNLAEFDYMVCGPPGMMTAMRSQLTEAGVPAGQIHMEEFSI